MGLVVCIGAGPAGLTAGYKLVQQKRQVLVLEADSTYVGGIARTVHEKDSKGEFCFDIGGHRFFSKSQEVVELWKEILDNELMTRPRKSRIFYGGKFYPYPLDLVRTLRNLGLVESSLCGLSYVKARLMPIPDPKTFEQWVSNQFGKRLFGIFFKTYTEKVWGMSCKEISADWAAQRIKGLSLSTAVKNAAMKALGIRGNGSIKTLIEEFLYPRLGPGMMWETAAKKIEAAGGKVTLGQKAEKLVYDEGRKEWKITVNPSPCRGEAGPVRRSSSWSEGGRGAQLGRLSQLSPHNHPNSPHPNPPPDGEGMVVYHAQHVISTMPLRELVYAIEGSPEAVKHAASQLRYRDFLIVALVMKDRQVFDDNWIYIHSPEVKVGRIQNFKAWSPDMVSDPKLACYGMEYFCFEGDGLWTSSNDALIRLASDELVRIGLANREDLLGGYVVRQPKAYPVYDQVYETHVDTIRDWLDKNCPNLQVVGRNGMHKYNNQDHSMMTAMLAVKNILAGKPEYDVWCVNQDAEYHEEHAPGSHGERSVPRPHSG